MRKNLYKIILTAVLIALRIVLERFLSYNVWNQRFGFSFVAVAVAAVMLGFPYSMAVAGIGDIIGCLLFPTGPYFPGFTLTAVLLGLCTGLFLYRNATVFRITLSVLINQLFGSVLLNSLWISMLYHVPYWTSLPNRIFQATVMTVLQIVVDVLLFSEKSPTRKLLKQITAQYR